MKVQLMILVAITLVAARKSRKFARNNGECKDVNYYCKESKEAKTLDCKRHEVAEFCPESCNKCAECQDKNPYCEQEMEAGNLICSRPDMADNCAYTCNKCGQQYTSSAWIAPGAAVGRMVKRLRRDARIVAGVKKLNQLRNDVSDQVRSNARGRRGDEGHLIPLLREKAVCEPSCENGECVGPNECDCNDGWEGDICDQEECADIESEEHCYDVIMDGKCYLPVEEEACRKSCGLCGQERSIARGKRGDKGKLMPLLRNEEECVDIESKKHCYKVIVDGKCDLPVEEEACRKSCGLCGQERSIARVKRGDKGKLMPLLRNEEECADSNHRKCMKVAQDNKCGIIHMAEACPLSCGLCDQERSIARGRRGDKGQLMPLLRNEEECADSNHGKCMKVAQDNKCGIIQLAEACPLSCGLCDPLRSVARGKRRAEGLLIPLLRQQGTATFVTRKKREDEGVLIPRPRQQETCRDSDKDYCIKVAQDGYCGEDDELHKKCPHSCGLCEQVEFINDRKKREDEGALLPLVDQQGKCADNNKDHCIKVIKDDLCGNHEIAKECPHSCGFCETCSDVSSYCTQKKDAGILDCKNHNVAEVCVRSCNKCGFPN